MQAFPDRRIRFMSLLFGNKGILFPEPAFLRNGAVSEILFQPDLNQFPYAISLDAGREHWSLVEKGKSPDALK
jgi:hypothetical protein